MQPYVDSMDAASVAGSPAAGELGDLMMYTSVPGSG